MSLRYAVKSTAERVLASGPAARISRTLRRGQAVVLSYHNIAPDGCAPAGDASLHLPRSLFSAQLDELSRTHDVVPLEAVLDDATASGSRPRAVITFDDAYRGAVTAGLDELRQRNMPATVFVAPRDLGSQAFWWDRLADPASGEIPSAVRECALEELAGERDRVLAQPAWSFSPVGAFRRDTLSATEEELHDAMSRHGGVSVASHSWSHPNLARLDATRVAEEIERPLAWLRERFSRVVPWLSYPYGRYSDDVRVAAARAGYIGAVTQAEGWIAAGKGDPFAVPRLNVPAGLSLNGFIARVAGVL